jgi:hypothetical protein
MNLPQNGESQLVDAIKFPLLVAFIVSKPIGAQIASVQPVVFTMFFVGQSSPSWLWKISEFMQQPLSLT